MWLQQLRVRHFRNLAPQLQQFQLGRQLIGGSNGAGKSSWLEAICVLLTGHSFRTHRLSELISYGQESAHLEAQIVCRGVHYLLQMHLSRSGKRLWLNRRSCRDWTGLFPCLCWVPEDLELVRGGPTERRRFLDQHLVQLDPLYGHYLSRYQRALEQRSVLLKEGRLEGLEVFEMQMALSASYLVQMRQKVLRQLQEPFSQRLHDLGFEGSHSLHYEGALADPQPKAYAAMWQRLREQERRLRQTLRGPHLDDLTILFQGHQARRFASEGQARACVAALKAAQWSHLVQHEGHALLLIDEIGMGLDRERVQRIGSWLKEWRQAFLTTPNELLLSDSDLVSWHLEQGQLRSSFPA